MDKPKLLAAGIGTSFALLGATMFIRRWRARNNVPTEWQQIGEVSDLFCFPIKSCGVVRVPKISCDLLGPQDPDNPLFRDRIFVVFNSETRKLVHARMHPKMIKLEPVIEGSRVTLNAPSSAPVTFDISDVVNRNERNQMELFDSMMDFLDCGDEVARWISQFVLGKESGLRLGYYPHQAPTRAASKLPRNQMWPDASIMDDHAGAMVDETSYMLINQASIVDLQSRLSPSLENVNALRFRPNIVISGELPAYGEDKVRWFRIGEKVVFRNLKPCLRCIFTTIDPETAVKNPNMEPLKTLRKYRLVPGCENSPAMGVHLGVVTSDVIRLGDPVYIPK